MEQRKNSSRNPDQQGLCPLGHHECDLETLIFLAPFSSYRWLAQNLPNPIPLYSTITFFPYQITTVYFWLYKISAHFYFDKEISKRDYIFVIRQKKKKVVHWPYNMGRMNPRTSSTHGSLSFSSWWGRGNLHTSLSLPPLPPAAGSNCGCILESPGSLRNTYAWKVPPKINYFTVRLGHQYFF